MRDFVTCDIRECRGTSVSLTVVFWSWLGKRFVLFSRTLRPPLTPTPSFCTVGSGHSFLVGEVVGWSGCETDHPLLSITWVNECTHTSSHCICSHNMHRDILPYWMMLEQSHWAHFRWVVCVA